MCTTIQQILWSCLSGYAVMVVSVSLMWLYVSVCSVILHHAHITPRLFNYLSKYSDLCKAAYGWPVIQKCSQVCAIPCCALSGPLHPISCWLTRHFHQHGRQPEIKLHPTTSLCGLLRMWGCFSTCHVSIRSCFTCWSFELGLALQYHVWVCVKPLCWVWHYSTMYEYVLILCVGSGITIPCMSMCWSFVLGLALQYHAWVWVTNRTGFQCMTSWKCTIEL